MSIFWQLDMPDLLPGLLELLELGAPCCYWSTPVDCAVSASSASIRGPPERALSCVPLTEPRRRPTRLQTVRPSYQSLTDGGRRLQSSSSVAASILKEVDEIAESDAEARVEGGGGGGVGEGVTV